MARNCGVANGYRGAGRFSDALIIVYLRNAANHDDHSDGIGRPNRHYNCNRAADGYGTGSNRAAHDANTASNSGATAPPDANPNGIDSYPDRCIDPNPNYVAPNTDGIGGANWRSGL